MILAYLFAIAIVPMLGLPMRFMEVQKLYAVLGAMFIPLLAVVLLALNSRRVWVNGLVNRWPTVGILLAALAISGWFVWIKLVE